MWRCNCHEVQSEFFFFLFFLVSFFFLFFFLSVVFFVFFLFLRLFRNALLAFNLWLYWMPAFVWLVRNSIFLTNFFKASQFCLSFMTWAVHLTCVIPRASNCMTSQRYCWWKLDERPRVMHAGDSGFLFLSPSFCFFFPFSSCFFFCFFFHDDLKRETSAYSVLVRSPFIYPPPALGHRPNELSAANSALPSRPQLVQSVLFSSLQHLWFWYAYFRLPLNKKHRMPHVLLSTCRLRQRAVTWTPVTIAAEPTTR